ncbi:MAG: hypothetical protein ACJ8EH_00030 [Sphingomicrobium sp.]
MTTGRIIELVVAAMFIVAAVWLYRRNKAADAGYGSQGAVLLLAVGIIAAIHALGGLDYRPSASELEALR